MNPRYPLVLVALLVLVAVPFAAFADSDAVNRQKQSMLGAGIKFSTDKPFFRGDSLDTRNSEKVVKATEGNPMDGGMLTGSLFGGDKDVEYRYRYEYPYDDSTVLFDKSAFAVLCEECKAKAVLNACPECKGKSFAELCDKCKAGAILDACDADRAKIRAGSKSGDASAKAVKPVKSAKKAGRSSKKAAKSGN